jgi:exo-1,4-beta-D-glucosaminidase
MHRYLSYLFVCLVFVCSCNTKNNRAPNKVLLKDNWGLQSSAKLNESGDVLSQGTIDTKDWYKISVPTTVLAALVDNNVYPDPYYGDNLKSIPGYREGRWLSMYPDSPFYPTWWYRKTFEIPQTMVGKNLTLHLDGINYKANVWLNGTQVADSLNVVGMFGRFEFDITAAAKVGEENILAVEISAPGKIPDIKYRTKQQEATTGWDDHNPQPPDLNMGIWRDVYVTASGPVRIKHTYVATDLDLPSLDVARLTVSAELTNASNETIAGQLSGQIGSIRFNQKVSLSPNEQKLVVFSPEEFETLVVNNPKLWWPHPVGPQNLHTADLQFEIDGEPSDFTSVDFGIREVSTYIDDEGWRGYKVNGENILIRGGAWMTSDMMLQLSDRRYDALVRYARNANFNMLRSEGFSIRETDEFYDICDKYGIMVTQQIFGRSIPDEDLAVGNVKDMILRIRNHPSLVHFLGHDETFPTPTLDNAYLDLIAQYTPERTYQPHSGAFDIEERFETGGTRTGTLELWTYAPPNHYYTHKEDGAWGFAQSGGIGGIVAPYESMKKMMPAENLWPLKNETFSFHTVLQSLQYFNAVMEALNNRYGIQQNIEDFCTKAQALNYESARAMYESYARNKYDALGITTWKYDAAWPASITWQYVDWYLNVGGAYYGAQKACEPLHVQYSYDDHSVYVLNSFYEKYENLKVVATAYNFDLSNKFSNNKIVNVDKDGKTKAFEINLPDDMSRTFFLKLELFETNGERITDNFYWLSTQEDIVENKGVSPSDNGWYYFTSDVKSFADFTDLQSLPKIELEVEKNLKSDGDEISAVVEIKNPTSTLAFMVHPVIVNKKNGDEVTPTFWDENYICLLPGESKTVNARFYKRDVKVSDAEVKISGWNLK